jgi:hypothetical protein
VQTIPIASSLLIYRSLQAQLFSSQVGLLEKHNCLQLPDAENSAMNFYLLESKLKQGITALP